MICVALSSGDSFYVDAPITELVSALAAEGWVSIGKRYVQASQVAQLTVEEMSSIHTPEKLEQEVADDATGD